MTNLPIKLSGKDHIKIIETMIDEKEISIEELSKKTTLDFKLIENFISALEQGDREYFKRNNNIYTATDRTNDLLSLFLSVENKKTVSEWQNEIKDKIQSFTDPMNLAIQLYPLQPYFYDKSRIWWMWDKKKLCWGIVDETDVLNQIDASLVNPSGTTNSKLKNEILESLKRYGRKKIPKNVGKTWVQFGNNIIDIETEEEIEPTPDIFSTNQIPWEIGESEDTPTIDKLFEEWVGEDYKKALYQIIAYTTLPNYPIHRIFCFNGMGCNGKSSYISLIRKFIGKDNTCSSSLDLLSTNRFESSKLYRKLICTMGETNMGTLSKTDILKRLTGEDEIGFEFKGKDAFTSMNYAKLIIATNSLPATTDKTIGFYRRWMVIDFPNIFEEGNDVIKDIPDEEFNNLSKKTIRILKELLLDGNFDNEGTIEDRRDKYEQTSNIVASFIVEKCMDDPDEDIPFSEFRRELKRYISSKKVRKLSSKAISILLDLEGYGLDRINKKTEDEKWTTAMCVIGLKWKDKKEQETLI